MMITSTQVAAVVESSAEIDPHLLKRNDNMSGRKIINMILFVAFFVVLYNLSIALFHLFI